MVTGALEQQDDRASVLGLLQGVCANQGLDGAANKLAAIGGFVVDDLRSIDGVLEEMRIPSDRVGAAATHLLAAPGKRLRPLCVALAARMGSGFSAQARTLAVAVELVHNATLLHDDVVDLGASRRGRETARVVYGNAASVFAGDWLLIEALRRVRQAEVPGVLDMLLAVIEEMIAAESLQLESRGVVRPDFEHYDQIVRGKTASLFRFALGAGARAGGLPSDQWAPLETFGAEMGIAFQIVDDVLDFDGDAAVTGKGLFKDLQEGKATFPLLVALQRAPELGPRIRGWLAGDFKEDEVLPEVQRAIADADAVAASRARADAHVAKAIKAIEGLPPSPARIALASVAEAAVRRNR